MFDNEDQELSLKEKIQKYLPSYIEEIFFNQKFNKYNQKEVFQILLAGPYVCRIKKDSSIDLEDYSSENEYGKYMLLIKNLINKLSQDITFIDARKFLIHEMDRGMRYDYGKYSRYARIDEHYKVTIQQILDILRVVQLDMKCLPSEKIPSLEVLCSKIEKRVSHLSSSLYKVSFKLMQSTCNYDAFNTYINELSKENFESVFYQLDAIFWNYQFILQVFYEPIGDNETSKFLGYLKTINPDTTNIQTLYSLLCFLYMRRDDICNDRLVSEVLKAGLEKSEISVESLFKAFETSAMTSGPAIVPYKGTLKDQGSEEPNIYSKLFNSNIYDTIDKSIESLKEKYKFN